MNMQDLFDAISESGRLERGRYQMTLGRAIKELGALNKSSEIVFDNGTYPGTADSYRGYYSDLSIAPTGERKTVSDLLDTMKAALGATFMGYKGGDFTMKEDTPLWTALYGQTGPAIMEFVSIDGKITIKTKDID